MTNLRLASLLALASLAVSASAGLTLHDDHPTYALPVSGTKTVSIYGRIILEPEEKDAPQVHVEPFDDPILLAGPNYYVLTATKNPKLLAYEAASLPWTDYDGPLLDFTLTPTTVVGDYNFGGLGRPMFWFFNVYGQHREPYGINVVPAPEPASFVPLGLGALALLRRRKLA